MSDDRRKKQYLREAAELLAKQEAEAAAEGGVSPAIRAIQRMKEPGRLAIFNIDLLMQLVGSMANQVVIAGGPHIAQGFAQFIPLLQGFRNQVMEKEGSGLVIAQPGDVPRNGAPT